MPSLKYYREERAEFEEAYNLKLSDAQAETIVRKLCHHFMKKRASIVGKALRNPKIRFYGNNQSGNAYFGWNVEIRLSHEPSLGIVCHEVGHVVERYNRKPAVKRTHFHTKKLRRIVGKLIQYAMKKGLWIKLEPSMELKA